MLGGHHAVGRQKSEGAAARPLSEQETHRGHRERHHVGQASSDLPCKPAFLCRFGQGGPRGVDDREQREPHLGGQAHSPPCFAKAVGPERPTLPGKEAILPNDYARRQPELGHGQDETTAALALLGAAQDRHRMRCGTEELLHPWAIWPAGVLDRLPCRNVFDRFFRRCLRGRNLVDRGAHHVECPGRYLREGFRREHGVDETQAIKVLGHLDPVGKSVAVERLIDTRPEKPYERSGLRSGQLPERPPGGEHSTSGRMAQVHEIGKTGAAVLHQRLDNLDHLQKGHCSLLHACATRHG